MSNKDTIKVLSERQQARDKVAIWFGSKDNFIHPLKECIANGIDEINNNFESGEITVRLEKDGTVHITDTGRGIPINGKTDKIPNYELLLLKLFAGTNYDNGSNGKLTTGTNGVGLTVTNYCSSKFKVVSCREDGRHVIGFENGGEIKLPLETGENNLDFHGTMITFKLDKSVFGDYKYDIEEIKSILKNSAGVNSKIKFVFQYECEDAIEYHYNSLEEFFNEESSNNTCNNIIGFKEEFINTVETSEGVSVEEKDYVELILTTSTDPIQKAYLNITHLSEGGSINDGVVFGVREFVNKYATDKKLLDKKLGIVSNNDIRDSISFVCNVLSTVVEFANQTKLSTKKSIYNRIVWRYTKTLLESELIENPKNIDKLVKHILSIQKFNNKSKNDRDKIKNELTKKIDNISNRVKKLTDCDKHGKDSELFIAEGDSASGSIVLARDASFQACIAIRGKIMNILKKDYSEIFACQTIMDIMKTLGCGVESKKNKDLGEFRIEDLRYGKIIIATDADPDGFQIACLLLSMFYKLTPTLLKEGYIYIANTPLYEVKLKNGKELYWFSESEKDNYIELNSSNDILSLSRCKGLGELDAEIMSETGVNPETRNITRVTVDNVEEMIRVFEIWMEEEVKYRKEIIQNDLDKVEIE